LFELPLQLLIVLELPLLLLPFEVFSSLFQNPRLGILLRALKRIGQRQALRVCWGVYEVDLPSKDNQRSQDDPNGPALSNWSGGIRAILFFLAFVWRHHDSPLW
jgi:hypothetical protein